MRITKEKTTVGGNKPILQLNQLCVLICNFHITTLHQFGREIESYKL